MKKVFVFAWLMLGTACVSAYQQQPTDYAHNDPALGATRKLGRGVSNIGLGWVEFFKGIQSVADEKGFWAGATWGPLYGAANAVKRTGVGVVETVTFPASGGNNYEPMLEPEFVLGDENAG